MKDILKKWIDVVKQHWGKAFATLALLTTLQSCNNTKNWIESKKSDTTEVLDTKKDIYKEEQFNIPLTKEEFTEMTEYIIKEWESVWWPWQEDEKIYDIKDEEWNKYRFMTIIKDQYSVNTDEKEYFSNYQEWDMCKIFVSFSKNWINDFEHNNLNYILTEDWVHEVYKNDKSNISKHTNIINAEDQLKIVESIKLMQDKISK